MTRQTARLIRGVMKQYPPMYEQLDDPIAVIALHEDGQIHPLRFRWNGQAYHVGRVTGHWVVHEGESKHHHYTALCEKSGVFELCYDAQHIAWRLRSVYLDG